LRLLTYLTQATHIRKGHECTQLFASLKWTILWHSQWQNNYFFYEILSYLRYARVSLMLYLWSPFFNFYRKLLSLFSWITFLGTIPIKINNNYHCCMYHFQLHSCHHIEFSKHSSSICFVLWITKHNLTY
jgi:hypothetical protein